MDLEEKNDLVFFEIETFYISIVYRHFISIFGDFNFISNIFGFKLNSFLRGENYPFKLNGDTRFPAVLPV